MDDTQTLRLPVTVGELLLRQIGPRDFNDLRSYWSDPEVMKYCWGPLTDDQISGTIREQAEDGVGGPGTSLYLAVVLDRMLIGDCQLAISPDGRQGTVGFMFNPRFTGRGLATRAVVATLGVGFVQLELHRIDAAVDVRNERSWKLLDRIGMRREGHLIHGSYSNGEWVDDYMYAILDSEWHDKHPHVATAVGFKNRG
ncbi:Spermidine N(1)-acetyltransferase [Gemmata sp. SH-PL17]|uniref:GNAT family N-acetyltransferase n=1 Tax=Gemmata sp. SH-PL17 TaxID=1630693 RepID=UPI0004B131DD|nr:GNAT family protein [Gemmata sp. SH-PL17]AMV25823.1 Spermidine N(1)-acetyltransferase [Gemmata sp. SH-PL17]